MKKLSLLLALIISFTAPAEAAITQVSSWFRVTAPDTPASLIALYCEEYLIVEDGATGIQYQQRDCAGTPYNEVYFTPVGKTLIKQTTASAMASTIFTGSSSSCVKGDGSIGSCGSASVNSVFGRTGAVVSANGDYTTSQVTEGSGLYFTDERAQDAVGNIMTGGGDITVTYNDGANTITVANAARSFNYTTRSLNTCFQVSASRDAIATYSVDIATTLSLTGGTTGTVYLETFNDSGCTTGTQEITRFVNGNTGTLTIGLNITQNVTGTLSGVIPAGKYAKLRTQNNTGTPTFTARPGQETLL